ncbi:hypothetical protein BDW75DRAFT_104125 [Aspergillus navahoensis]
MASCITALRLCLGRAPRRSDNTSDPGSAQFHNDKPGVHIDAGYHPPPCLETPLALSLFAPSNPPHEHEGPVTSYLVTWPRLFKALFGFIRGIPRDEDDEREPLLREAYLISTIGLLPHHHPRRRLVPCQVTWFAKIGYLQILVRFGRQLATGRQFLLSSC